ncbi:MAG: hypothetical protein IKK51_07955 [Oscillospiraceae bacterium]|nr:hypothetical protein [Oscillospiraceae bacterium]
MNIKKTLAGIASYALVGAVAAGVAGTLAGLTDVQADANTFVAGDISISQDEYQRVVDANGKFIRTEYSATFGNDTYYEDKVEPFKQLKAMLPVTESVYFDNRNGNTKASGDGSHQQSWTQVGAPGSNQLFDENIAGVQDKFVFVKNTGSNPCYYRTVIAVESPENAKGGISTLTNSNTRFDWNQEMPGNQNLKSSEIEKIENVYIDGVRYYLLVATYINELAPNEVSRPSLLQVYMDSEVDNETYEMFGDEVNILVATQAVQTGSLSEIPEGKSLAQALLDNAFGGPISATNHPWLDEELLPEKITGTDEAEVKEAFKDAATAEKKQIVINLDADVTYDVTAWAVNGLGGSVTEEIIINGNGHTITFNQTNSDWSNIVTNNGAKLCIYDAKITNSGHNDGPWNRHDLNFACDVVLNNVTSDKAMAFKANAELTNVTISDANTSDTYAIWIQPKGQTVSLNGCTIDMIACTDGRGLKIDNQYVDAAEEAKVTLNVSDTVFMTEEKSAILVKSVAGADITLDNVDISGVAADSVNPVWIDDATEAYADKVTVTGGSVILEP